jgi:hypothetical protein
VFTSSLVPDPDSLSWTHLEDAAGQAQVAALSQARSQVNNARGQ